MLVACTLNDPTPLDQVCLITETVRYQLQDAAQQEISRQSFRYENGRLAAYSDKTPDRSISFSFKYVGGKVASAYTSDEATVLSFNYDEFERIKSASYIVNNKEQSVFSLFYDSNSRTVRLVRLVETRVLLPTNSFIASRTFQFSYREIADNTEDLVSQTVQNGYKDGSRTEEELVFEQNSQNHSPFYDASGQAIVLALLALTNHTESNAASYLQRYDTRSFTRQVTAPNGSVVLSESSQFSTSFDGSYNPSQSTQFSHLSVPADTFPADRRYQQTYTYNCIE
ncbi:hypothetical protein GCM10028803_39370 [Larkinella knui]